VFEKGEAVKSPCVQPETDSVEKKDCIVAMQYRELQFMYIQMEFCEKSTLRYIN
jgi:hypothetical protein